MNTTIAIPIDIRDQLKEFGEKGETYAEVIERLIKSARKRMLHDLLMDTSDSVPVEKALEEAKRRWQ
jgi:predicted CopG family antitoxin